MSSDINKLMNAWLQVQEKKLDPVGKADADIDNDGDVDSSDAYLKNRRKKISKSMDEGKVECPKCKGEGCDHCDDKGYHMEEMYVDKSVKRSTGKSMDPNSSASKSNAKLSKKIADGPQHKTKDWKYKKTDEGTYVGPAPHAGPKYVGGNNSKDSKDIKTHLTKKGHTFDDHGHVSANKSKNQHYISMHTKAGHDELQKYKKKKGMGEHPPKTNEEVEVIDESISSQHVKQGIGIARDKRYAGGNTTGAVNAMKKIHPNLHKHPKVRAELKRQAESVWKETLKTIPENRRVTKWSDFSEDYDEFKMKGKKRPQDRPLGKSDDAPTTDDYKKHTDGGTRPEGMFDKESKKGEEFIKMHQKSDPKWEDLEDDSHDDVSKAGRGVSTQSPNRMGRDHRDTGDKNVVKPINQKF